MDENNNFNDNQGQYDSRPQYTVPPSAPYREDLSLKDWLIILLLSAIPCVNIIMLLIWAFSANENPNKSNYAKAQLILMVIGIILSFILLSAISSIIMQAYPGFYYQELVFIFKLLKDFIAGNVPLKARFSSGLLILRKFN